MPQSLLVKRLCTLSSFSMSPIRLGDKQYYCTPKWDARKLKMLEQADHCHALQNTLRYSLHAYVP